MWFDRLRKLLFGLLGLVFLAWGLWFLAPAAPVLTDKLDVAAVSSVMAAATAIAGTKLSLYGLFKDGVWLIVGAVIVGNMGEHLAKALQAVKGKE